MTGIDGVVGGGSCDGSRRCGVMGSRTNVRWFAASMLYC